MTCAYPSPIEREILYRRNWLSPSNKYRGDAGFRSMVRFDCLVMSHFLRSSFEFADSILYQLELERRRKHTLQRLH